MLRLKYQKSEAESFSLGKKKETKETKRWVTSVKTNNFSSSECSIESFWKGYKKKEEERKKKYKNSNFAEKNHICNHRNKDGTNILIGKNKRCILYIKLEQILEKMLIENTFQDA